MLAGALGPRCSSAAHLRQKLRRTAQQLQEIKGNEAYTALHGSVTHTYLDCLNNTPLTIVQYNSLQPLHQPCLLTLGVDPRQFPCGRLSRGGRGDPAQEKALLQEVLSKLGFAAKVPDKYCGWTQVRCGSGESSECVKEIGLRGRGLDGQVPKELVKLRGLHFVLLDSNPKLAGNLHDFQHLTQLQGLHLDQTAITGSLQNLQNMTDLQTLHLQHTAITGSLQNLQNMTDLQTLHLQHTAITGSLQNLQNMTDLQNLWLDHTAITGSLQNLQNMTDLQTLRLDHTAITGSLQNLQNMTDLGTLRLDHTAITGKLEDLKEEGPVE